jgi:two-component system, LuxR family, sensor kinase FixL
MPTAYAVTPEIRYRRLFETAYDGILIVDPESRKTLDANPYLLSLIGYTYAEFIGKELYEYGFAEHAGVNKAAFQELLAIGYVRYDHLPLRAKNGRRIEVEFVCNLYQEADQRIIQCNIRDISERKKNEAAFRDLQEQLTRYTVELENSVQLRTSELRLSIAQLENFAHSISHDLRGPLRTLQGFSQLLLEEHQDQLNQQGQDYARFIQTAARNMEHLLADLLAFSRISRETIELTPVHLESVVREALVVCETPIAQSRAHVEIIEPLADILAHTTTLQRVLVNLITNAVKFVQNHPPWVRIRTEQRPGGIVRIWVEDNGIGIPAEFQEQIFHVFRRLHSTAYGGTGIGLAVVQKGVDRMGGRVGVFSEPAKGSRFWVELYRAAPVTT